MRIERKTIRRGTGESPFGSEESVMTSILFIQLWVSPLDFVNRNQLRCKVMGSPSVLIVAGRKNSGKTTLVERLIPELKRRRISVGAVKHDFHGTFTWDEPGKDTDRFWKSGVDAVSIIGPGKYAVKYRADGEEPLGGVIGRFFRGFDVVLAEGFRRDPYPKIEVVRSEVSPEPIFPEGVIAMVTDADLEWSGRIIPLNRVDLLADFILEYFSLI